MNCERGDLLIGLLEPSTTAPEDAALSPAERVEAEAHVAACPACREALGAYRGLATALRAGAAADEAPAPEATARAYAAVLEAMQAGNAGGVRLLAGGATRAQAGGRVGMRRPRAWLTGFAAAACLLLVAGLVLAPRRDASAPVAAQRQHEDAAAQAEPAEARRLLGAARGSGAGRDSRALGGCRGGEGLPTRSAGARAELG
ncbi:MAG: zf-HC2 domain-containing protein [Planctomycetes bacterium]|nr:zf-HC2 domain-containing protein [Planctomycetota bacterium]